jgi:menaquinone-specific isochorismate synthase
VQHLYNTLHSTLKAGISNAELIRALHPTPALGGFPREQALSFIKTHEPFEREWYGAPIGWISPTAASFHVGIRSAILRNHTLEIFAGTGIVKESQAEKEWEELNHKIRPFMEYLNEL